jgi:hypothetical protein
LTLFQPRSPLPRIILQRFPLATTMLPTVCFRLALAARLPCAFPSSALRCTTRALCVSDALQARQPRRGAQRARWRRQGAQGNVEAEDSLKRGWSAQSSAQDKKKEEDELQHNNSTWNPFEKSTPDYYGYAPQTRPFIEAGGELERAMLTALARDADAADPQELLPIPLMRRARLWLQTRQLTRAFGIDSEDLREVREHTRERGGGGIEGGRKKEEERERDFYGSSFVLSFFLSFFLSFSQSTLTKCRSLKFFACGSILIAAHGSGQVFNLAPACVLTSRPPLSPHSSPRRSLRILCTLSRPRTRRSLPGSSPACPPRPIT